MAKVIDGRKRITALDVLKSHSIYGLASFSAWDRWPQQYSLEGGFVTEISQQSARPTVCF
jgi:glutaredoxin-related protein